MSKQKLRITLVKSPIGYKKRQKATVRALGLRTDALQRRPRGHPAGPWHD